MLSDQQLVHFGSLGDSGVTWTECGVVSGKNLPLTTVLSCVTCMRCQRSARFAEVRDQFPPVWLDVREYREREEGAPRQLQLREVAWGSGDDAAGAAACEELAVDYGERCWRCGGADPGLVARSRIIGGVLAQLLEDEIDVDEAKAHSACVKLRQRFDRSCSWCEPQDDD